MGQVKSGFSPMYAIFLKTRGFKDIKCGISSKISHRKFSTKYFQTNIFHQKFSTKNIPQQFYTKHFPPKLLQSLLGELNPSQQGRRGAERLFCSLECCLNLPNFPVLSIAELTMLTVIYRYKIGTQLALKTIKDFCFRETCNV